MPVATAFVSPPLGYSIPYLTPHAVSVSLPTWRDNVGYEEGDKRVVDAMQTGYPRFFVHRSIQKVRSALGGLAARLCCFVVASKLTRIVFANVIIPRFSDSHCIGHNLHPDLCSSPAWQTSNSPTNPVTAASSFRHYASQAER